MSRDAQEPRAACVCGYCPEGETQCRWNEEDAMDAEGRGPELTTVPPDWEGLDEQGRGWYFHLREGFYFRGRGDAVTLAVKCEGGYQTITVPPNEWASAVAAVSKRGDVQTAWAEALAVHEKDSDAGA